jgi:hypothetical protein
MEAITKVASLMGKRSAEVRKNRAGNSQAFNDQMRKLSEKALEKRKAKVGMPR